MAPLSAAEIAFAVAQTRRWAAGRKASAPPQLVFYEIDLHECASTEAKEAALRGDWEALPPRRARVVAGEPAARRVLVGDVAVGPTDGEAPHLAERARTQPCFAAEEYAAAERLVVAYPPFRAACAARGIAPEHVRVDPWCAGWYSADDDPARRLSVPMLFVQARVVVVVSLTLAPTLALALALALASALAPTRTLTLTLIRSGLRITSTLGRSRASA